MKTDDLRESPNVELAETLLGKGLNVRIYDPIVNPTRLVGANRTYIESKLPHLQRLLTDSVGEALEGADIAIVSSTDPAVVAALLAIAARVDHRHQRPPRPPTSSRCRGTRASGGERATVSPTTTSTPRRQPPARPDHRAEPAGAVRPAGLARVPGAHRRRLRGARRLPEGTGRPDARDRRRRDAAQVPPEPRGFGPVRVPRRVLVLVRDDRSGSRPARSGAAASTSSRRCNPPDIFWVLGLIFGALTGCLFVYDQHDLCPELYESRFGEGSRFAATGLQALERLNYRTADHVIATNESYRKVAIARGHKRPADVTVVRTGPDARGAAPASRPIRCASAATRYLAAYIGVMGPQDGVDYVVRAAHEIVHTHRPHRHRLHAHGQRRLLRRAGRAARRARSRRLRRVHGPRSRRRGQARALDRRRRALARSQEPAERRLDDEQDHRVHGVRAAGRRVRPARDAGLGRRRGGVRRAEPGRVVRAGDRRPHRRRAPPQGDGCGRPASHRDRARPGCISDPNYVGVYDSLLRPGPNGSAPGDEEAKNGA